MKNNLKFSIVSIGKSGRVGGGDYNNIIMENFFDQVEMKVTSILEIYKYFKKNFD